MKCNLLQKIKEKYSNLLLLAFSILFIFLVFELVFRIFDIRGFYYNRTRQWNHALVSSENRLPGVSIQFKPYSQFELNYDSNPTGYFNKKNGITYKMNKYGLRGNDYDMQKKTGTKRVIVLGDSFTFGEGVKLKDTFCNLLQKRLNNSASEIEIEILNFGVSAWNTSDEINYLEQMGIKFQPDLVIVVFVLNDANDLINTFNAFRKTFETRKFQKSWVINYIYSAMRRQKNTRKHIKNMVESSSKHKKVWARCFRYLSKGEKIAKSIGSKYMICIFPFMYELTDNYPMKSVHQSIYDYCSKENLIVLDLLDSFKGESYTSLWAHPSDQHPNRKAHKIAAKAIAEFVQKKLLL